MSQVRSRSLALAIGSVLAAGCGAPASTHPARTPSSTPGPLSVAAAGRAYLAAVKPDNRAVAAFKAAPSATLAKGAAAAVPLIAADQTLETRLESIDWPSKATPDVHVLIIDLVQEVGSLQGV